MISLLCINNETLSTKPNAIVFETGLYWTKISANCNFIETRQKLFRFDTYDLQSRRFDYCSKTHEWWVAEDEQRKEYYQKFLAEEAKFMIKPEHNFRELRTLCNWIKQRRVDFVIANSPAFDLVQLKNLFDHFKLETPWKFWQEFDYRTLKILATAKMKKDKLQIPNFCAQKMPHHGDEDAKIELNQTIQFLSILGLIPEDLS